MIIFRPRKRKAWIDQIRQQGWHVRVVYQIYHVSPAMKQVVIDAAAGNWQSSAAAFSKKGLEIFLLADSDARFEQEELSKAGVKAVLYQDEQFCSRYLAFISDIPTESEKDVPTTGEELPLSQRLKKRASIEDPEDLKEIQDDRLDSEGSLKEMREEEIQSESEHPPSISQEKGTEDTSSLPSAITVYAAKGGVGKTVFLSNLAALLSRHGIQVCILDLDLYQGTVASTLHLHPKWTITDWIGKSRDVKAREACQLRHPLGFTLIAAPTRYMDISGINAASLTTCIRQLKQEFELVLIDTSVIWDEGVQAAIQASDLLLLMTTDEPASVKNLLKMKGTLLEGNETKTAVIRNRVGTAGVSLEKTMEYLPWPILFNLREMPEVAAAANKGGCLAITNPGHPYSVQLHHWVTEWLGEAPAVSSSWKMKGRSWRQWKKGGVRD